MRSRWMAVLAAAGLQIFGAELDSKAAAKNCQTAADCGRASATCELTTYQTCAGKDPLCPAGSSCGDKPTMDNQTNCAPYVEGICRQPYELPCQVDTDCGVGFRCAEQIGRACMGMATTGGNGIPPSFHEECHETRGTFACELLETSCTADGDCGAGLRCLQSQASTCGATVASPESPSSPDAAIAVADCAKVPMVCAPDGYFGDLATNPREGEVASGDDRGGAGGSVPGDASIPAADEASATLESESPAHAVDDGCSLVAGTHAGRSELSWLAFAGVLVLKRRRRARA